MTIIFFINSKTVCIEDYNIKDVLGSSGRLDVISRCILAAILNIDGFDKNTQIWAFLDKYGTFTAGGKPRIKYRGLMSLWPDL